MKARSLILWSCCLVVCLLAAQHNAVAQGGGTRCWQMVSGSDVKCAGNSCLSTDGCTAYPFTASCSGVYAIDAWTTCNEGKCFWCMSCVNICNKSGDRLANCHTTNCDNEICECSCTGGVLLDAGGEYTMYVCLIACAPDSCPHCGEDCEAYGCVRYNTLPLCWQQ